MKLKNYLKLIFVTTLLAGCATPQPKIKIELKNQKVCVVAGIISAGVECTYTIHGFNHSMTLDELIVFLEGDQQNGRLPAVIMPLEDFAEMKNALDVACALAKENCKVAIR